MKRFIILSAFLLIICAPALIALQPESADIAIDVDAYILAAEAIFLAGAGGMSVNALVNVFKRMLKADGIGVILLSIGVSVAAVILYLIPTGFDWIKFVIYSTMVALAANGIYLNPLKRPRTPKL